MQDWLAAAAATQCCPGSDSPRHAITQQLRTWIAHSRVWRSVHRYPRWPTNQCRDMLATRRKATISQASNRDDIIVYTFSDPPATMPVPHLECCNSNEDREAAVHARHAGCSCHTQHEASSEAPMPCHASIIDQIEIVGERCTEHNPPAGTPPLPQGGLLPPP
jgi:hypothetical protein